MNFIKRLISAFLGGVAIALSGAVGLSLSETPVAAAFVSSIGFLAMIVFELQGFVSKAGYLLRGKGRFESRLLNLLVCLIGNLLGAVGCGILLSGSMRSIAYTVIASKSFSSLWETLVGGFFCGILMFIAVHGYRRLNGGFVGCITVAFSIAAFQLCGFLHPVLEAFHFAAARYTFNARVIAYILLASVGSFVGALLFSELYSFKNSEDGKAYRRRSHHHHSGDADMSKERKHKEDHNHHSSKEKEREEPAEEPQKEYRHKEDHGHHA